MDERTRNLILFKIYATDAEIARMGENIGPGFFILLGVIFVSIAVAAWWIIFQ